MNNTAAAVHHSDHGSHERRDIHVKTLAILATGLVLITALLLALLWMLQRVVVPKVKPGASLPVQMPGEPAVNARIEAIPPPRIDSLVTLEADPPSFHSSRPIVSAVSPDIHAEDLRADHQSCLKTYGWVDQKKRIARIPIEEAMEVVLQSGRLATSSKKGGQP